MNLLTFLKTKLQVFLFCPFWSVYTFFFHRFYICMLGLVRNYKSGLLHYREEWMRNLRPNFHVSPKGPLISEPLSNRVSERASESACMCSHFRQPSPPCLQLHFLARTSYFSHASIPTSTLSSVPSPTSSPLRLSRSMEASSWPPDSTLLSRRRRKPSLPAAAAAGPVRYLPVL